MGWTGIAGATEVHRPLGLLFAWLEGVFLGGVIVAAISGVHPMKVDFAEAVIGLMAAARACAFLTGERR